MGVIDLNARLKEAEETLSEYGATLDQLDTAVDGCLPLTGGTISGDLVVDGWKNVALGNETVCFGPTGKPTKSNIFTASAVESVADCGVITTTPAGQEPVSTLVGGMNKYAAAATGAFDGKAGFCIAVPISGTKIIQFAVSLDGNKLGVRIGEITQGHTSVTFGSWKAVTLS